MEYDDPIIVPFLYRTKARTVIKVKLVEKRKDQEETKSTENGKETDVINMLERIGVLVDGRDLGTHPCLGNRLILVVRS